MKDPDDMHYHVLEVLMERYRKLLRMESLGVWTPTRDEEIVNLREFIDALDEGRVTIEPRRP